MTAYRMAADGVTVAAVAQVQVVTGATSSTRTFTLPAGTYRFGVVATNAVGNSASSARSNAVVPR